MITPDSFDKFNKVNDAEAVAGLVHQCLGIFSQQLKQQMPMMGEALEASLNALNTHFNAHFGSSRKSPQEVLSGMGPIGHRIYEHIELNRILGVLDALPSGSAHDIQEEYQQKFNFHPEEERTNQFWNLSRSLAELLTSNLIPDDLCPRRENFAEHYLAKITETALFSVLVKHHYWGSNTDVTRYITLYLPSDDGIECPCVVIIGSNGTKKLYYYHLYEKLWVETNGTLLIPGTFYRLMIEANKLLKSVGVTMDECSLEVFDPFRNKLTELAQLQPEVVLLQLGLKDRKELEEKYGFVWDQNQVNNWDAENTKRTTLILQYNYRGLSYRITLEEDGTLIGQQLFFQKENQGRPTTSFHYQLFAKQLEKALGVIYTDLANPPQPTEAA